MTDCLFLMCVAWPLVMAVLHIRIHGHDRLFVSDVCSMASSDVSITQTHSWPWQTVCFWCVYCVAWPLVMVALHRRIHGHDRLFVSDVCSMAFSDVSITQTHSWPWQTVCFWCVYCVAWPLVMTALHRRIHGHDRLFVSDVCSMASSDGSITHTHSRPWQTVCFWCV